LSRAEGSRVWVRDSTETALRHFSVRYNNISTAARSIVINNYNINNGEKTIGVYRSILTSDLRVHRNLL
jgi:hypothetical protein